MAEFGQMCTNTSPLRNAEALTSMNEFDDHSFWRKQIRLTIVEVSELVPPVCIEKLGKLPLF